MMKRHALLLAASLILPSLAMGDTLRLPSEARIDVQVIDTLSLNQATPSRANVLLKRVVRKSVPAAVDGERHHTSCRRTA